jgi:hypothetical protein
MLRVYPNPWAARDRHGKPCGVYPLDTEYSVLAFIGAEVDRDATKVVSRGALGPVIQFRHGDGTLLPQQDRRQRTSYKWRGMTADTVTPEGIIAAGALELPSTPFYRAGIHSGCLVAADKDTAGRCRIRRGYREPLDVLREAAGVKVSDQKQTKKAQAAGGDVK